jgi:hypothetical protein
MDLKDIRLIEFIEKNKIIFDKNSFFLSSINELDDLVCLNIYFKKNNSYGKFCKKDNVIIVFLFEGEWKYYGEFNYSRGVGSLLYEKGLITNLEMGKIEKILRDFIIFDF